MTYFVKQHARNTKAILDTKTPAEAEIWYDQTTKKLRWGDGATLGGFLVQRENFRNGLSPAQITADTHDYAPTGLEEVGILILDLDADHNLTGLAGGSDGREIMIAVKNGSVGKLTLKYQDTDSTTNNRLLLGTGGDIVIGPNQAVTFRYDGSVNRWVSFFTVVTDLVGQVAFSGAIAPAVSANQNNWSPAALAGASTILAAPNANRDITGLVGGRNGREITIFNTAAFVLTLKAESGSSTAANRFLLPADINLAQYEAVTLRYDSTQSRWLAINIASGIAALSATLTGILAGSSPGVSDTLTNVLTTATGRAAGLAIALG